MSAATQAVHAPMQREPQAHRDRTRLLVANLMFVLATLLIAYVLCYSYQASCQETARKEQEVERLRQEIARVSKRNQEIKGHIGFMQTPAGVEKLARERLGLVRPNETSYIVVHANHKPESPPPAPAAPAEPPMSLLHRCTHWFHVLWNGGD